VGKQYQVTRERIRPIEAKALRKLRHPTRIPHLQGFLEGAEAGAIAGLDEEGSARLGACRLDALQRQPKAEAEHQGQAAKE